MTSSLRVATRSLLLAGIAALALPARALAQEEPEELAQPAEAAEDAPVQAGNEIIVTATKREQTLQEIPVAVSVTTAETIERAQIRDITDLQTVVPSLRVTQSQGQFATTYNIRGFGTSGNNLGLEPSVAVFVDGVYRSRAISQISDFPDLQRVEVLRGPQSTLFGKNASAGVISIVSRKPRFDFGGQVEASYGIWDAMVLKGYVTGPISETVAASLAAGYNRRDGYLTNLATGTDVNDRNRWFTRGQLLFEPSDTLSVRLIGDYDEIDEVCCGVLNFRRSAATLAVEAVGGRVNDPNRPFDDEIYSDVDPVSKVRNWGLSGQVDYEIGPLTATSITAYRDTRLRADQDVDFTSARLATGANVGQADIETFTQEVRLATNLQGPLNVLIGGYYFNERLRTKDQIVYGADFRSYVNLLVGGLSGGQLNAPTLENLFGVPSGTFFAAGQGFFNDLAQDNEAYSLFGNVDFEVADGLNLTLGANYTHDAKDVVSNSLSTDRFSQVDLAVAGSAVVRNQAIATQVGSALRLGRLATAGEIGAFAAAQPAIFGQINAGATAFAAANANNPAVNSFLGLRPLQFLPPFQNFPNAVESGKSRDSDWSYTARLAYEVNDNLNVYASYATGFKASSFNLSRDSRPLAADVTALRAAGLAVTNLRPGSRFARPENSEVYELGVKGNWGVASANLTLFKQVLKDFQTNTFVGTGFIFGNAEKQTTDGVEFDGQVNPTDELTLSLAMTYLDPRYDSFVGSPLGDLSGTDIVTRTQLSATFGAQWDQPLGNGDRIIARGDFHYEADVQDAEGLPEFATTNPDGTRNFAPARAAARPFRREVNDLNASLTYAFEMGLELSVWGRNLLDHRYLLGIFDSVAQSQSISGYTNQPRTYGVSARYRF
jgi:outer membrane receptor protein involved in Fe transport